MHVPPICPAKTGEPGNFPIVRSLRAKSGLPNRRLFSGVTCGFSFDGFGLRAVEADHQTIAERDSRVDPTFSMRPGMGMLESAGLPRAGLLCPATVWRIKMWLAMRGRSKAWLILALVVLAIALTSCAPGPDAQRHLPDASGHIAGFWLGLWHGIIAPVTFFISLFKNSVNIYEVHNKGNWYNFGFVLGAGILFGGGAAGSRKRKS